MIGDTTFDMEMALAAGVGALGVAWGYHPPDELRAAGAHGVVDELRAPAGRRSMLSSRAGSGQHERRTRTAEPAPIKVPGKEALQAAVAQALLQGRDRRRGRRRLRHPARRPAGAHAEQAAAGGADAGAGRGDRRGVGGAERAHRSRRRCRCRGSPSPRIDGVAEQMAEVAADIVKFAGSDLLCYRAEAPAGLVRAAGAGVGSGAALGRGRARRPLQARRGRDAGGAEPRSARAGGGRGRAVRAPWRSPACTS